MIFKQSRLFNKILLLFIILAIVPFLFFSYRVVSITTKYMQTDETLGHSHEAVRIHEEAMVKVINKLRHEIIIFVGYSLLLAIILSIIFARTIIKPRKELIKGTKIIDVQSGDEFRQLAASFNRMAELGWMEAAYSSSMTEGNILFADPIKGSPRNLSGSSAK
ncbi:MAG: hypothetical protein HZC12_06550 [Nitrospirae bacterium]|nr:hypothetical protein [Nitrospirota bacterium]